MSGQESEEVQSDGGVRMLSLGPLLVHNNHIQSGLKKIRRCGVCATGLDSAYEAVEKEKPLDKPDAVPEGDGADKERDSAHPRDFRDYTSGEAGELLGSG